MASGNKVVLIYIPCYSDFDLAISQAQKIRNEFKENRKHISSFISKIEIVISVNYFKPSESQLVYASSVSDLIINNSKLFLADVNISNGFMVAYQRSVDFLWILSANDELLELGLSKMLNALDSEIDLSGFISFAIHLKFYFIEEREFKQTKLLLLIIIWHGIKI